MYNYQTVADFTSQDGIAMSDLLLRLYLATSVISELGRVADTFCSVSDGPMVELMVLETCLLIYSQGLAEASGSLGQGAMDILNNAYPGGVQRKNSERACMRNTGRLPCWTSYNVGHKHASTQLVHCREASEL